MLTNLTIEQPLTSTLPSIRLTHGCLFFYKLFEFVHYSSRRCTNLVPTLNNQNAIYEELPLPSQAKITNLNIIKLGNWQESVPNENRKFHLAAQTSDNEIATHVA